MGKLWLQINATKKLNDVQGIHYNVVTDQAIVTLATNDAYCRGALVLCQSLKSHNTTRPVVVLFTPQVSSRMRYALKSLFDEAIEVDVLDSGDSAHLALLSRPELGITFTKIHCWCLVQYSKCVFMDADMLVCQNIDDLFEREELSAAPDPGWPDCFNSGLFVYKPSIETYNQLLQFAVENGSFDGGDQGLLNSFFSGWPTQDIRKHLPFIYNLAGIALYSYLPAFKRFGASVKVVHFLGPTKPWHFRYDAATKNVVQENMSPADSMFLSFLNVWWDIYTTFILPLLAQESGEKEVHELLLEAERCRASLRRGVDIGAVKRMSQSIEPTRPFTAEPIYGVISTEDFHHIPKIVVQPPDSFQLIEPKIFVPPTRIWHPLFPILKSPRKSHWKMKKDTVEPGSTYVLKKRKTKKIFEVFKSTRNRIMKRKDDASSTTKGQIIARKYADKVRRQFVPYIREPTTLSPKMQMAAFEDESTIAKRGETSSEDESSKKEERVPFKMMLMQKEREELESLKSTASVEEEKESPSPASDQTTKDVADRLSELSLDVAPAAPAEPQDRRRWEEGNVDYMGRDAFVNIQRKLDQFLK
ncbi:glycogenin-2 [Rhinoraja longicauda]